MDLSVGLGDRKGDRRLESADDAAVKIEVHALRRDGGGLLSHGGRNRGTGDQERCQERFGKWSFHDGNQW
jgi:hypothetical protein